MFPDAFWMLSENAHCEFWAWGNAVLLNVRQVTKYISGTCPRAQPRDICSAGRPMAPEHPRQRGRCHPRMPYGRKPEPQSDGGLWHRPAGADGSFLSVRPWVRSVGSKRPIRTHGGQFVSAPRRTGGGTSGASTCSPPVPESPGIAWDRLAFSQVLVREEGSGTDHGRSHAGAV